MTDILTQFEDVNVPNDRIDIYSDPDIHIRILKSVNLLEFRAELSGNSIDNSVVNAIRRTILRKIPVYAFNRSNIYIDVKHSYHMYNNDLIYNQIETLPLFDIPNDFDLENPNLYLPNEAMKIEYGHHESDMIAVTSNNKKLANIELTLNYKNETDDYKYLNTHDVILKINEKVVDNYTKKPPICFLVLKPNEELSFRAVANLGISEMNASYEATTNAIHIQISPTNYILTFETLQQLDKNVIFKKACLIIIKKIELFIDYINNKYGIGQDIPRDLEIQLYGECHTLGNLIATVLQKCEFVENAAYTVPHPLHDQVLIAYKITPDSKLDTIAVLIQCCIYLVKLFKRIIKLSGL